jgi:spore germination protein
MVGWLGQKETKGANWLMNEVEGGVIEAIFPTGDPVVYEIRNAQTKIIPTVKHGRISFSVEIQTEGSLGESWVGQEDALDPQYVSKVDKVVEEEIKQLVEDALKTLQKKYKLDPVGFQQALKIHEYATWKEVRNEWGKGEKIFSEVPVTVKVQVNIRNYGTTRETG